MSKFKLKSNGKEYEVSTYIGTKVYENPYPLSSYFYVDIELEFLQKELRRETEFITVKVLESYRSKEDDDIFKSKKVNKEIHRSCFKVLQEVSLCEMFKYSVEKDLPNE